MEKNYDELVNMAKDRMAGTVKGVISASLEGGHHVLNALKGNATDVHNTDK